VRLPKQFRFDTTQVSIRKDELTGEVILKPIETEQSRKERLAALLKLLAMASFTEDFIPERVVIESRNPFEDWVL
jgi:antitoxin VapB